jgi:hypothetical protein
MAAKTCHWQCLGSLGSLGNNVSIKWRSIVMVSLLITFAWMKIPSSLRLRRRFPILLKCL